METMLSAVEEEPDEKSSVEEEAKYVVSRLEDCSVQGYYSSLKKA